MVTVIKNNYMFLLVVPFYLILSCTQMGSNHKRADFLKHDKEISDLFFSVGEKEFNQFNLNRARKCLHMSLDYNKNNERAEKLLNKINGLLALKNKKKIVCSYIDDIAYAKYVRTKNINIELWTSFLKSKDANKQEMAKRFWGRIEKYLYKKTTTKTVSEWLKWIKNNSVILKQENISPKKGTVNNIRWRSIGKSKAGQSYIHEVRTIFTSIKKIDAQRNEVVINAGSKDGIRTGIRVNVINIMKAQNQTINKKIIRTENNDILLEGTIHKLFKKKSIVKVPRENIVSLSKEYLVWLSIPTGRRKLMITPKVIEVMNDANSKQEEICSVKISCGKNSNITKGREVVFTRDQQYICKGNIKEVKEQFSIVEIVKKSVPKSLLNNKPILTVGDTVSPDNGVSFYGPIENVRGVDQ